MALIPVICNEESRVMLFSRTKNLHSRDVVKSNLGTRYRVVVNTTTNSRVFHRDTIEEAERVAVASRSLFNFISCAIYLRHKCVSHYIKKH